MNERKHDTSAENKSRLAKKAETGKELSTENIKTFSSGHSLLERANGKIGDPSITRSHASILKKAKKSNSSQSDHFLLQLQRQYGNRYVQRVMDLSRKADRNTSVTPEVEQSIQQARGSGQALDSKVRGQMESSFGTDFSDVRVHANVEADSLNRALSSRAFTTGQNIFFRQNEYNPGSSTGRELLAHELTHVVQQTGGVQGKMSVRQVNDKYEQEADRVAREVVQHEQQVATKKADETRVQRQPLEEEEEEEAIQAKLTTSETLVQRQGDGGEAENRTGMPDHLKTDLEQLSGMDLSDVRVHNNSSKPAQLNALAYAQGQDVHIGPGQEKHLPHEAWHVVQQIQGRVKPTMQVKGTSINDDKALEREADLMGARALQMKGNEQATMGISPQIGMPKSGPVIQRWVKLGTESWEISGWGTRVMTVWTGTKDEWIGELDDMDDRDEYWKNLKGFLYVSNDPSIANRTRAPRHIGNVPYSNTITRVPNDREKLEFLRALYEMGGSLDLWRGSFWEGGQWTRYAENDLATFINNNQGMLIADVSARGEVIGSAGVRAIAEQGGRRPTMAMIMNAGATAHKGVDLIVTSNLQSGQARQSAHAIAMETIRNAGRVIREALNAHDARVAFEQQVVGVIFDTVWGFIPGGGTLTSAAKGLLKVGLSEALKKAQEEGGPRAQAEKINDGFVATCNGMVYAGHITSADAQDAINGFEAVRR